MDQNNLIECGGFFFIHNFDSGNLGHVERVPTELIVPSIINHKTNAVETPDYEFNLWTRPDCAGTHFENGNRTWFYFGVQASEPNVLVRLNLINLNKQGKMYTQGMAPVTRTLPGKPQWERIRDRPVHSLDDNTFTLTFKYRTSDNVKATTFFAFTYPFSFAELQITLNSIDMKMLPLPPPQSLDDIYYCRECLVYSLEGRRVDLLTITSHHGITDEREERLKNLFPDNLDRPFKFKDKKIIFISARVHPGETPSSFVFNGFLNLILNRSDPIATQLRRLYVFKMIPFLNPDGVARGHYRTDTRGVNLNRVYLNPSLHLHPTVYASRSLIRYYHFGCEKEDSFDDSKSIINESSEQIEHQKKKKGGKEPPKADTKQQAKTSNAYKASTAASTDTGCKDRGTEAANLADQVCDMSLHDISLQTHYHSSSSKEDLEPVPSVLNDSMLRSCLGSGVHLSTSEEIKIPGKNPLRPLRDSLKNSISLLMGSGSSVAGDSAISDKTTIANNIKTGMCSLCRRRAAQKLFVTEQVNTAARVDYGDKQEERSESRTFESIEEYREDQRRQLEEEARLILKAAEAEAEAEARRVEASRIENETQGAGIYICTNCFKRFEINDDDVEVIKESESLPSISQSLSVGESGDVRQLSIPSNAGATKSRAPRQRRVPPSPAAVAAAPPRRSKPPLPPPPPQPPPHKHQEGNLFLYIDLHGHASKKGIFMYGNHFEDLESSVECMLLPRIMSLNNLHFHFSSCNFTERNMYLRDRRDGMSREGSGRVAVLKATGLVRSYTLECNYNTGRLVNVLPPAVRDPPTAHVAHAPAPPKYTPHIYEEVGRSLGASILDLTGHHPNSRIPCSEHRNLSAVRDWLRAHTRISRPMINMPRIRQKPTSPSRVPIYARSKPKAIEERKENSYAGAKTDTERKRTPPVINQRSQHEIISVNMKYVRKNEPAKSSSRTKCLTENEPKPKIMTTKRRSILGIRKPNTSKTQVSGVVKAKVSRRSIEDASNPRQVKSKLRKRSFSRPVRGGKRSNCCREMASSSSEDTLGWDEMQSTAGSLAVDSLSMSAKRRPYASQPPALLKKIRLKSGM